MHRTINPTETIRSCKIKRVNPAFRSVSTPRETKDLRNLGPVNPSRSQRHSRETSCNSEWSAEGLCERLRNELAPLAWVRPIRAARRRGWTSEDLFRSALEAA